MDVNLKRVAVVPPREPQTLRDSNFTCAYSGDLFPFAATLEVTYATIAIYDEDNGEHSVEADPTFCPRQRLYDALLLKSPQDSAEPSTHTKGVTTAFPRPTSRANWIPSRPRCCS
ncbi:hypothetical protein ACLK19_05485 [Escherichia coli]